MPVFKPELNTSYDLALKYRTGIDRQSRFGPRVQYTLSDGQVLYVPPACAAKIQELHIDALEPFRLKRYIGSSGETLWDIERGAAPDNTNNSGERPVPKPMQTSRHIGAPAKTPIPPSLTTAESQRIFRQLVAAIEAAKAAEDFARSINFDLKLTSEDVRAMAISGFIEQSRRAA